MDYEPVIGLETHAELLTESKLWCGCGTRFGQAPNTQTCPVCLGMPGVLPVLNGRAFELALTAAVALDCAISPTTFFDRKNYYYPDLPKNYQVSQNYSNLGTGGRLEVPLDGEARTVGITNVHLEEDAGKNLHAERGGSPAGGVAGADYSLVDLNRAGVPLLEIVSAPDMHSVAEADAYMQTLRQILLYTQVSDCKMEEGRLRFEASISMRPAGTSGLGARVEIKNLNSMKAVRGALEYEIRRQTKLLSEGGVVAQETRLWDEASHAGASHAGAHGATARMRSKEEAQDYRYFPEPDLLPVEVSEELIARVRAGLPELPVARRRRFVERLGLSEYDAQVLTEDPALADYFEACLAEHNAPKSVANWIMNVVLGLVNEGGISINQFGVKPKELAQLVALIDEGRINAQAARMVMAELVRLRHEVVHQAGPGQGPGVRAADDVAMVVMRMGLEQISDEGALGAIADQVIAQNLQPVQDYLDGKQAALGALVGQVMRATRGKADPKVAGAILRRKLDAMR